MSLSATLGQTPHPPFELRTDLWPSPLQSSPITAPPPISACATEPCLHCFYYPIQSLLDQPPDPALMSPRQHDAVGWAVADYSCRRGRRTRSIDVEFGRARLLRCCLGDIAPASLTNCRMQKAMQVRHASVPDVCTVPALKKSVEKNTRTHT